ncbi:hypothetical protein V2J09_015376 [Rumex salicifolius]
MASEAQTHEELSLLLPFLLGVASIDPSHSRSDPDENSPDPDQISANGPDPRARSERIILMNPFMQGMVVIGEALFQDEQKKQGRPPASKAAIESMAVVEIEENEMGECAICLEDWRNSGVIVKEMPCKHRFHGDCIEKWLGIHGSCPVCRFEMPCDQENDEKKSSGDGGERRIWVSLTFGGRDGNGRNPDRSSLGDDHQAPSSTESNRRQNKFSVVAIEVVLESLIVQNVPSNLQVENFSNLIWAYPKISDQIKL